MKKLKKIIEKKYFKNKQQLYVDYTHEYLEEYTSIYACNKKGEESKFLFYITNLRGEDEVDLMTSYFKETKEILINNIVKLSNKPLYMDEQFTLKKVEKLTEKDILNCTKYFLKEILNCWLVFNIKLVNKKDIGIK